MVSDSGYYTDLSTKTSCCWSSVSYALKLLTNNFLRLCRHEKCSGLVWTRTETSRSFEVRTGAVGNKGLVYKSSTSLLSINFRVRGLLLFRYCSNASVHNATKKGTEIYPICDNPLPRSARRKFTTLESFRSRFVVTRLRFDVQT